MRIKPAKYTWPEFIEKGIGLSLSKIGERVGSDALVYNRIVLKIFHTFAMQNAPDVVASMKESFPEAKSVIDVGCGSGAFAAECNRQGLSAIGLERSPHGVAMARKQGVDCRTFDVTICKGNAETQSADLVYSFEVAEHVPQALADDFVDYMTQLGPLVVFSAAQPGQGGIGHINEQPLDYWIEKFDKSGFELCQSGTTALRQKFKDRDTDFWFQNNTCVFRKAS